MPDTSPDARRRARRASAERATTRVSRAEVIDVLRDGGPVCVCAHASPDGDALGSLLGLGPLARRDGPRRRALPGRRRAVPARARLPRARRASQRRVPADAARAHADRARLRLGAAHRPPRRGRRAVRARRQHRPSPRQHALRHRQPRRSPRPPAPPRSSPGLLDEAGIPLAEGARARALRRPRHRHRPLPVRQHHPARAPPRGAAAARRACSPRSVFATLFESLPLSRQRLLGLALGRAQVAAGGRLAVTWLARDDFDVDRRRRRVLGRRRRRAARDRGRRAGRARARAARPQRAGAQGLAALPRGRARLLRDRARAGRRRAPRRRRVLDGRVGGGDRGVPGAGGGGVNAAVLLVDKPAGPTSFGCVARVRGALGGRRVKVGHAGTLDPFATGLLALLVGRATRLAPYLVGLDKRYRAVVQLGVRSDTGDPEGTLEPGEGAAARRGGARSAPAPRLVGIDLAGAARRPRRSRSAASAPMRLPGRARRSRCRRARCIVHALDVVSYDAATRPRRARRPLLEGHVRPRAGARPRRGARLRRLLRRAAPAGDRAPGDRARGHAGRRRGRSARRAVAHAAAARRSRTCPRASSSRPSATRCCTAAPSRAHGEDGPLRCLAEGRARVRRRAARRRSCARSWWWTRNEGRRRHRAARARRRRVIALGTFDGVHLGHRRLIHEALARAQELGATSTVATFEPMPSEMLRPGQAPRRLSGIERRAELIARGGRRRAARDRVHARALAALAGGLRRAGAGRPERAPCTSSWARTTASATPPRATRRR